MEELNRKVPQLPWIVAAIGIVIAGYFFMSANKVDTEILNRQNEITACKLKLEQYEKLKAAYGRASENYYADKPLLILKPEGSEGKITIYWNTSNLTVPNGTEPTAHRSNSDGFSAKWADNWYGDEGNLADLIVTPGKNTGCYPITFSNNLTDDKFQVLVVIK